MLATVLLWAAPAAAASPFTVTTAAGVFEVTDWEAPTVSGRQGVSGACRVRWWWTPDGIEAKERDCPKTLARATVKTVREAWSVRGPDDYSRRENLGELWFVYPEDPDAPVLTWVLQGPDRQLTLPDGVDAVPFSVQAWAFLRFPTEAIEQDLPKTRCAAEMNVDPEGVPTRVVVAGCEDPFRATVEQTLGAWRFTPPRLGDAPLPSGLEVEVVFDPATLAAVPDADRPSEESQALWAERQFSQLTREERLWFIEATLLGPDRNLGPGQVQVRLPRAPLVNAGPRWFGEPTLTRRAVPPLPDHGPLFRMTREGRSDVEVFELKRGTPPVVERDQRCALTVQVDGHRAVWAWPQPDDCDDSVRDWAVQAAEGWILRHQATQVAEKRERFDALLVVGPDGLSEVWLDHDQVPDGRKGLPADVHLRRDASLATRVPPRIPRRLLDGGLEGGACRFDVQVDAKGKPHHIEMVECPEAYAPYAQKAVRKYRWEPAALDGEPIEGRDQIVIRFAD